MKGVLICGGNGTRLRPLTDITNKSLLPVYDKPLVLYPLSVLLKAGIREIAIVTGPEHIDQMTAFLGSGSRFGCHFDFCVQKKPGGIGEALGLAERFAAGESVCAILGDNIFFDDLAPVISSFKQGAHIFLKQVEDPRRFGVAQTTENETGGLSVISVEEKPASPKSSLAITGCYLYDNGCFEIIRSLKPSARGEIEITDVSAAYLRKNALSATLLKKDWVDAGTFESLFLAATLVRNQPRSDL